MVKVIFVAGGVMSGIGKGIATASMGKILISKGFKVTAIKIDPYINIDAGTMNPIEHGEVFVTEDGLECDQDVGNYERFLDENIYDTNYITTGRVYRSVINKERNLGYKGKCVEVVPHIPEEVINRIKKAGKNKDFVLVEIGGTVGEYQNMLFLEAARMMKMKHPKSVLFVFMGYLPILKNTGEMKTKPTQYAVRTLNSAGVHPDIILARSSALLDGVRKEKLAIFCNVSLKDIISAPDVKSIYEVPINFENDNLGNRILSKLNLKAKKADLKKWKSLVNNIHSVKKEVKIAIVGKYFKTGNFSLKDSYISVIEAVKHACYDNKVKPVIEWISAESYENNPNLLKKLKQYHGVIIPGGFGQRGIQGKIKVIEYCRKNKIPFLGLCIGMQLAVIEFAKNVANLKNAYSTEFKKKCSPIIDVLPEQKKILKNKNYGNTMRLGSYECHINKQTKAYQFYKKTSVLERHRHRYEFNNEYRELLEGKGMIFSGINKNKNLIEIIELKDHPFFLAVQFHPEFKSRPNKPHPLFKGFIKACQ